MNLWDEPWELTVAHHRYEAGREARAIVRTGFRLAGLMPRDLPPEPDPTGQALHMKRALHALDVIRLGTEGGLRLKGSVLAEDALGMPSGVITEYSAPIVLSDAKIVRAARRALAGQVRPRASHR